MQLPPHQKISKASQLIEDIHDVKWSVVSVKSREPTIPEHQLISVDIISICL